jgi:hypothetical protein
MFSPQGRPTLWPSHLTNYWKYLRKKLGKTTSIKYYACGEYGSIKKKQRPHYHAIVFLNGSITAIQAVNLFESAWQNGQTFTGTVTAESVAYVLKYISKRGQVPEYSGDNRIREFQRSSKGLGLDYLTDRQKNWHHADLEKRAYIPLTDNRKAPLPRYYKDKLFTKEQKKQIGEYMQQNSDSIDYLTLKEQRKRSSRLINS